MILGSVISYADTNSIQSMNMEKYNYLNEENISMLASTRAITRGDSVKHTVGGITYSGNTAIATLLLGKVQAISSVTSSKKVLAGYMGAHTAVYRDGTGSAVSSSSWTYNKSAGLLHQVDSVYSSAKKGQKFRAQGTMRSYNPANGGYISKSLTASPYATYSAYPLNSDDEYLSYKTMNLEISDEEVQERIKMYEDKRMISAEGLNGKEGYIFLEDMGIDENPNSPEEAIKLQEERIQKYGEYRDIKLYDIDGKTVIDTFRVWNK